jgi:propionyl-CoA carboxylase alpha chain
MAPSGWRNARMPAERVEFVVAPDVDPDERLTVAYRANRDGSFRLEPEGHVIVHRWSPFDIDIEIDGRRTTMLVTRAAEVVHVQLPDGTVSLPISPRFVVPGSEAPTGGLIAPMPGVVIDLRVAVGDEVEFGQVLVVLEAMKMEHHITAPFDGTVTEVPIAVDDQLENGALLLMLVADGEESPESEEDADDG